MKDYSRLYNVYQCISLENIISSMDIYLHNFNYVYVNSIYYSRSYMISILHLCNAVSLGL